MRIGEPFVYYRGRRGVPAGEEKYAYIGTGVIGDVRPSQNVGKWMALVHDFNAFSSPVPFKLNGQYLEPVPDRGGSATGSYFRGTSVREVSTEVLTTILEIADRVAPPRTRQTRAPVASPFGSPEHAAAVDEAGMQIAMREVALRWPDAEIHRMPHNNPGFDILVVRDDVEHYVEVKSTAGSTLRFHLSEGQRLYAIRHHDRYSLLVITGAYPTQLADASAHWRDGALEGEDLSLTPTAWLGELAT
jgi:hypothetical protein